MGLILDIVLNHMSTSLENAWWRDVIEYGQQSRYFRYFDIDGSRPLTLPFLGDTLEAELEKGAIALKRDPVTYKAALVYYDAEYPLNPGTYSEDKSIAELHEAQSWRLMSWCGKRRSSSRGGASSRSPGWSAFGLKTTSVFDDSHRLILESPTESTTSTAWPIRWGICSALREKTGPDCYITVEKILAKGEQLPPTGRYPAPPATSLSPRWRKCWSTT